MPDETMHHAHPRIRAHAREMRHDAVPAEQKLWWKLRDRRLAGFKFRRQQPVGPFIADFYCSECRLAVELDGDTHDGREEYDEARTQWLAASGVTVIRFVNDDVHKNLEAVVEAIFKTCEQRRAHRSGSAHPPSPLAGEGRGGAYGSKGRRTTTL
jgi:very-short-patch-repair endonuclease